MLKSAFEPEFQPLDPRFIKIERVVGMIVAAVIGLGTIIGMAIWGLVAMSWIWGVSAGGAFVVVIGLTIISWFWPVWEYKYTGWRLTETELEIRKGVLWRHRISVPMARVQHADVTQGPVQRMYELGNLVVHTAGTQNASVEIGGLTHQTALDLRDRLVIQREAFDVV